MSNTETTKLEPLSDELISLILRLNGYSFKSSLHLLHQACKNGDIKNIILLLNNNFNPNIQDKNGNTPLHYAINNGYIDIVQLLLENNVDIHIQNNNGQTAFHFACYNNSLNLLPLLLNKGALINQQDNNGYTPLFYAIKNGDIKITQFLLDNGVNLTITDNKNNNVLQQSFFRDCNLDISKLLLNHISDIDIINNINMYNESALILCTYYGTYELMEKMINKGADVNIVDNKGNKAIFYAIYNYYSYKGDDNKIKLLLNYDNNLNHKNNEDETPLIYTIKKGELSALYLLLEYGADPNLIDIKTKGNTPLILAAYKGQIEMVEALLKKSAYINTKNKLGKSAYTITKSKEIKELLVKYGYKIK